MNTETLAALLAREIRTLQREIDAYPEDSDLWKRVPGMTNSAGALAHHLTGNLRHFVGARLGGSGYVRDRDAEFARTDLTRGELSSLVDSAAAEVARTLGTLDAAALDKDYPEPVGGYRVRTGDFLLHLLAHFCYHLGQIDYHRRVVTGDARGVGAVATAEIPGATRSD